MTGPGDERPGLMERVISLYSDYAWAVDDRDLDALRELLTDDVRLTSGDWTAQGVDRFIETYERLLAGPPRPSRHLITNVRATTLEDGSIQTGAYFQAVFHDEASTRIQTGRYRDVHVETATGLRISHKQIEIDPDLRLARDRSPGDRHREGAHA